MYQFRYVDQNRCFVELINTKSPVNFNGFIRNLLISLSLISNATSASAIGVDVQEHVDYSANIIQNYGHKNIMPQVHIAHSANVFKSQWN